MSEDNKGGCLFGWLASLLKPGDQPGDAALPYKKREYFFSKAERSFYGVLEQSLEGQYVIFAKVRLSDIVEVVPGTEKRQGHMNRIASKHVDFVLCDAKYIKPVLVIELDDGSHERADRVDRDQLVDRILAAAQIPILRVPAKLGYAPKELRERINAAIQQAGKAPPEGRAA
jgi:very-short-patch-repair endonuclease